MLIFADLASGKGNDKGAELRQNLIYACCKKYFFIFVAGPVSNLCQNPASYELIFETDSTIEQTGLLTLRCRDSVTAEILDINEISFFLNRSSAADPSLREREDIRVVEVGTTGIKFNLTRRLEGYYTCGKKVDCTNVRESSSKALICKWIKQLRNLAGTLLIVLFIALQTTVPLMPLTQANYTAMSGDRVILQCPIQPGSLLQQYSVTWMKDNTAIAEATNPESVTTVDDARYKIDRATYSLIIDSVNINDSSSNYNCELSVVNPMTNAKRVLQPTPQVALSLNVISTCSYYDLCMFYSSFNTSLHGLHYHFVVVY